MKRIGILGGSFNPIHDGHIAISSLAAHYLKLDEVILIPNSVSPWKEESEVSFAHRYAMCKLAIQEQPNMQVSDIESKLPKPSYTIHTIELLHKAWNEVDEKVQVYFIIGDDQALLLHEWKEIERLATMVTFAIFVRNAKTVTCPYPHVIIPAIKHEASSTAIRKGDFRHLHKSVKEYILIHELYLDGIVRAILPQHRYEHTISVRSTALKIGSMHRLDQTKLSIAAYFHDIAKYMSKEIMAQYMEYESDWARSLPFAVHHQFAGARWVEEMLCVEDADILEAIRYHTTGSDNPYTKTLFVADKIEPNRGYDVSEEWALVSKDLNAGYEMVKQKQIEFIGGNRI